MPNTTTVPIGEYVFDVCVDGAENGIPIVLLHGFPQTSASWDCVVPHLTEAGFRTIAPDQRGYSPGARPEGVEAYRSEKLVGDVLGLLQAYRLSSAHIVGHDWGAAVAWQLAARHPASVRSLTAVSIPHTVAFGRAVREDPDQQSRSSYIGWFRERDDVEDALLAHGTEKLRQMFGDLPNENDIKRFRQPGALTAALNWYRAMTSDFGRIEHVTVPTTYIWGNEDAAVGRFAAEACGEFVDGDYRFVELDGVSHWVPEEAPERVATEIVANVAISRPRPGPSL